MYMSLDRDRESNMIHVTLQANHAPLKQVCLLDNALQLRLDPYSENVPLGGVSHRTIRT